MLGLEKHATYELSINRPNIFLDRVPYSSADVDRGSEAVHRRTSGSDDEEMKTLLKKWRKNLDYI